MKLQIRTCIIICLLFTGISSVKVKGQGIGFLGNRFSAGYHFVSAMNIYNLGDHYSTGIFSFRHEFDLDYVLGRRITVGAETGFASLNFLNSSQLQDFNAYVSYNYFGANFKFFKASGVTAPVGSYFKIKAGFMFVHLKSDPYYDADYQDLPVYVPGFQSSYKTKYAGIGYGNKHVFAKRIILDLCIELNCIIDKESGFMVVSDENALKQNREETTIGSIAGACSINYSIGIEGLFGKW